MSGRPGMHTRFSDLIDAMAAAKLYDLLVLPREENVRIYTSIVARWNNGIYVKAKGSRFRFVAAEEAALFVRVK